MGDVRHWRDLILAALLGAAIATAAAWVGTPSSRAAAAWEYVAVDCQQNLGQVQQQANQEIVRLRQRLEQLERQQPEQEDDGEGDGEE